MDQVCHIPHYSLCKKTPPSKEHLANSNIKDNVFELPDFVKFDAKYTNRAFDTKVNDLHKSDIRKQASSHKATLKRGLPTTGTSTNTQTDHQINKRLKIYTKNNRKVQSLTFGTNTPRTNVDSYNAVDINKDSINLENSTPRFPLPLTTNEAGSENALFLKPRLTKPSQRLEARLEADSEDALFLKPRLPPPFPRLEQRSSKAKDKNNLQQQRDSLDLTNLFLSGPRITYKKTPAKTSHNSATSVFVIPHRASGGSSKQPATSDSGAKVRYYTLFA